MIASTQKVRRQHNPTQTSIPDIIMLVKSLNPMKHNSKIALLKHNLGLLNSSASTMATNEMSLDEQITELQEEI